MYALVRLEPVREVLSENDIELNVEGASIARSKEVSS